ncbi:MAG: MltF family protein, partial [Planctomycetota bacterium]|jgi:membrane-bound lytic murein transglycosylase MltF
MLEAGVVRVLTPYDRTHFFIDRGRPRGVNYELFTRFEEALNAGRREKAVKVIFIPVPFDRLIPALEAGEGDVAVGSLTITPERSARVDFTRPLATGVKQIVVSGPDAAPITGFESLPGRAVHVMRGSSYAEYLREWNDQLVASGNPAVNVVELGDDLVTEDILEMVSAGLLDVTVVDEHLADLWAQVLPGLRLHRDLAIDVSGEIAWAIRRNSPQLRDRLNAFAAESRQGTLLGNILIKRYYESTKWVTDPTSPAERERLDRYVAFFKRYCTEYDFDWLLIAAQSYQESQLNPDIVSHAGAVGLMQLLPATAKDMGETNLRDPESNIRAGVKYMDWIRRNFFDDPALDPAVKVDFALASYNAGPSRVRRWRETARERGMPDRWFGSVERIALEEVGPEPVRYVANINKYYVAYSLALEIVSTRAGE